MKGMILPSLTAVALIAATGAYAAQATGSIKSMDSKAHTLTLDNGTVYQLPSKQDMSKMKAGEKVKITYQSKGGKHMATSVAAQ
ncbi:MAG TPA: DUF1344 domain-containing protein [Rhizobiaceae bacterium]|nr:DUF1344 domain-containing protein [Rhizobiaceae bacterium]